MKFEHIVSIDHLRQITLKIVLHYCVLLAANTLMLDAQALSGHISYSDGTPVEGAVITAQAMQKDQQRFTTSTDRSGRYEIPELPNGDYTVQAEAPGLMNVRYWPIRALYPRRLSQDFIMTVIDLRHEGGIYTESIVLGELTRAGVRLNAATICLASDTAGRKCTTTNALGQYSITVPSGTYTVAITWQGKPAGDQRLDLTNPSEYLDAIR